MDTNLCKNYTNRLLESLQKSFVQYIYGHLIQEFSKILLLVNQNQQAIIPQYKENKQIRCMKISWVNKIFIFQNVSK